MRSAKGISTQVREPSNFADQASAAAQEARASVDRLRESSAAIGNVVDLIAQIARQTRLLALNSTIEAARAGAAAKVLRLSPPRSRRWPCKRRARPKRSPKRSARSKRMPQAPLSGCSNCCLLSLPDANTSSRPSTRTEDRAARMARRPLRSCLSTTRGDLTCLFLIRRQPPLAGVRPAAHRSERAVGGIYNATMRLPHPRSLYGCTFSLFWFRVCRPVQQRRNPPVRFMNAYSSTNLQTAAARTRRKPPKRKPPALPIEEAEAWSVPHGKLTAARRNLLRPCRNELSLAA
jgi:hypothetical protein